MPSKPYDQLKLETQHVIDAMILGTEANRILTKRPIVDGRDAFIGHPELVVDYLRKYYALDIQTRPSLTDWSNPKAIVQDAINIQNDLMDASDGVSHLSDVIEHLTNLPYPEKSTGRLR